MRFHPRARVRGIASKRYTIDAVCLVYSGLAADRALRSVGGDALLAEVTGKLMSPPAQGRLPDVQTYAVFAHGFDDEVHVRMGFIGMQYQGVSVL